MKLNSEILPELPGPGTPRADDADAGSDQLARVRNALTTLGIRYRWLTITPAEGRAGLQVLGRDNGCLVLFASEASHDRLEVVAGVLKDMRHERSRVLDICNSLTRDNAAVPVCLNDTPAGWDIHVRQSLLMDLALPEPAYFRSCLNRMLLIASGIRLKLREAGIEGRPYGRSAADAQHLLDACR